MKADLSAIAENLSCTMCQGLMESDHRRFVPAPALLRIAASSGFHQELAHGAGGDSFIAEDNEGVKRYRITPGADTGINTLAKMTAIR